MRTRFALDLRRLCASNGWHPAQGRLLISVDGPVGVQEGDTLEAWLMARAMSPPANPGAYDSARQLRRQGVAGYAFVANPACLHVSRPPSWTRPMVSLYRRCDAAIAASLSGSSGAVVRRLVLGGSESMDPDLERDYRETGVIHLLAISGLNLGLVAGFCWILLSLAGVAPRPASAVVWAVVLGYAALAGFSPSVQRAAIMCAAISGAHFFRRRPDLAASVALALIAILLLKPADLFNAGLQLSFAAVAGIGLLARPIAGALFRPINPLDRLPDTPLRGWLLDVRRTLHLSFAASLAASACVAPLVAWHFNLVAPLAPLATLLLLPAAWLATVAGLSGALLGALWIPLGKPFLWAAGLGAWTMNGMTEKLARLPGVAFFIPPPGLATFAVCAAAVFLAYWSLRRNAGRLRLAWLALFPAIVFLGFTWRAPAPPHLRLHMLSVGRANAVLLRFPDGRNLLYDAGGRAPDDGARTLAPALWSLGVRRLDLVVLSHGDLDHTIALPELARRIPVRRIVVPPAFADAPESAAVLARMPAALPLETAVAGDMIEGFDARLDVLWPPARFPAKSAGSVNERCLVLRVRDANGSILLTGDFGRRVVPALLQTGADLRADVLQVPHHGLVDPSAARLAAAVRPRAALVPGQGEPQTLAIWQVASKRLITTDEGGMISVELSPQGPKVETFLTLAGEREGI